MTGHDRCGAAGSSKRGRIVTARVTTASENIGGLGVVVEARQVRLDPTVCGRFNARTAASGVVSITKPVAVTDATYRDDVFGPCLRT